MNLRISRTNLARIAIFHLSAFSVFFVGWSRVSVAVFLVSFCLRTFGVAAGYHRYFSHRSFRTTRLFQFTLGFLGASSGQKGPLSWVTSHRIHHQHSDTERDPHSPVHGAIYSYIGWLLAVGALPTDLELTADFAGYPEILWLNKYYNVATLAAVLSCLSLGWYFQAYHPEFGTGPWQLVVWGFVLSGLLCLHGTLMVNTICHSNPRRQKDTRDFSRNVAWLLPVTLGECWHHNHHRHPKSANCALDPGQVDFIYAAIAFCEKLGLVFDVKNHRLKATAIKSQSETN